MKLCVKTVCAINELVFARIDYHRNEARKWGRYIEDDGFPNHTLAEQEIQIANGLMQFACELREAVKDKIYFNGTKWVPIKKRKSWLIKKR